jgi:hypothetical protein
VLFINSKLSIKMKKILQNIFKATFLLATLLLVTNCQNDASLGETKVPTASDTGVGGSLARFTAVGNYLYVVDNTNLQMFDISQSDNPTFIKTVNVGRGIETIYPFGGKLFIGSQEGLYIYNINSDGTPSYISAYQHFTSCDPVATDGQFAYVTLRSQTDCNFGNGVDLLEILDVSDLNNPNLIASYEMESPLGVGVDGTTLFVCEVKNGLKIFDVTRKEDIQTIKHFENIEARDVIVLEDKTVLVLTPDMIYQLDYSDLTNIKVLSSLAIEV